MRHIHPHPDDWTASANGLGSCFHRALSRWALLHKQTSAQRWRIAVGVFIPGPLPDRTRSVHCWLEQGSDVMSAVDGKLYPREVFYAELHIEPETVRLINPRTILRAHRINRSSIQWLLSEWGGRYHVADNGGIIAD